MKTTISILTFVLLFNFSTAGIEPRGVKLETPIKGLLLSKKQKDTLKDKKHLAR